MKQLYSKYFPTPKFLAMSSYSLDISDQSIKYGQLNLSKNGLKLGAYGSVKIPKGVIESGKILNTDELVKVLKDLKQKEKFKFVRVALPEEQIYLFTLSLPKIDGGDLQEMILLQLEDHIPLLATDTLFDYDILSETDTSFFVEVVAIDADTINTYLSVFKESDLVPVAFELEAQSIAESVIPRGEKDTVMIVDFGEARTGISVAVNGKVIFTSTFDMGGNVFTEMIAKNYGISFSEAEDKKIFFSNNNSEAGEDLFPITLNVMAVLRDEINKHFSYWTTHQDENGNSRDPISRIILCGGGANIPGLAQYLAVSFKTKVEYAKAWVNISSMEDSIPNMTQKESLSYVTMLGLALGDYFV